jgi:hypothetical protein
MGNRRDMFSEPWTLSLVMLIVLRVTGLISCFALVQLSHSFRAQPLSFGADVQLSGDKFFTLGTANLHIDVESAGSVAMLEAGTGLAILANVIGYFPVLYQLFSRAETPSSFSTHMQVRHRPRQRCFPAKPIARAPTPLTYCCMKGSDGRRK